MPTPQVTNAANVRPPTLVPAGFELIRDALGTAVVRRDLAGLPLATWWQAGRPLVGARGRGAVAVLEPAPGLQAVARTYRRGGLLRRLLGDRYLRAGRALAELAVLAELVRHGVPVVRPLVAAARRRGACFRLRLVTELSDGRGLPEFIAGNPELRRRAIEESGRVVRAAFDAGLHHPDLHPDNLLARRHQDGVQVLLLDLDRARLRTAVGEPARDRMLVRMARYLHKHRARLAAPMAASDPLRFLRGMGLSRAERRQALARLAPRLRRALRAHRLVWKLS